MKATDPNSIEAEENARISASKKMKVKQKARKTIKKHNKSLVIWVLGNIKQFFKHI